MIKILALFFMLVDHVGYALFPDIVLFRIIGRFSMPLFAYMIARGYFATNMRGTKNVYVRNLVVLLFVSQVPYYLLFGELFTLNIAAAWLCGIFLIECLQQKTFCSLFSGVLVIIFASYGFVDYGFFAMCLVPVFYYFRVKDIKLTHLFLFVTSMLLVYLKLYGAVAQLFCVFGFVILEVCLRLEAGCKNLKAIRLPKKFAYSFYPLHMLILALVRYIITLV